LLAPTYEYGYVGFVVLFYHSGSIITRGWVRWKGKVGSEQYVSCMFRFLVYFSVFSCMNQDLRGGRGFLSEPGLAG